MNNNTNTEIEALTADIREIKSLMESKTLRVATKDRPALSTKSEFNDVHQKAMNQYIRLGDESELRAIGIEEKSLSTAVNSDGGFLVDPQTSEKISSVLAGASSLRALSNVVQVEASSYDILVDHGEFGAGWAGENQARLETEAAEFARISISLHELSAMPKSSQRLLDDAAFDVETWLGERIAASFAQSESAAFIAGDGADKPNGILSKTIVQNDEWSWGSLGAVHTGVAGDFSATHAADAIIDLVYALGARYRTNASFVMNSKTAGAVRKMKDSEGRFMWSDSVTQAQPAQLLGYSVLICEDMPDVSPDACAIAFGDFRAGYTIAERPDLRILRDPFSAKPHVLFYATKRVGGDVTDYSAIKFLKFAE